MIETINIEQEVMFEKASPKDVYDLLMDAKKFSKWSGSRAKISPNVGGAVIAFDGYIRAINVELLVGKRIVQAWKGGNPEWPEDHFSIVTFDLSKTARATKLTLTHFAVPKRGSKIIVQGWPEAFWEPMKNYLSA